MANLPMSIERAPSVGSSIPPIPVAAAKAAPGPATLDDLAAMTAADLHDVYAAAATPTIAEVVGDLRGRMLAFDVLGLRRGLLARALRAFAGWRFFSWRRESLQTLGSAHREVINRVFGDRQARPRFP